MGSLTLKEHFSDSGSGFSHHLGAQIQDRRSVPTSHKPLKTREFHVHDVTCIVRRTPLQNPLAQFRFSIRNCVVEMLIGISTRNCAAPGTARKFPGIALRVTGACGPGDREVRARAYGTRIRNSGAYGTCKENESAFTCNTCKAF